MNKKFFFLIAFVCISILSTGQNYITLHDQCNYSGRQYTLEAGSYRTSMIKIDNDRLSSIQIPAGMKVTIFENDKFSGRSNTYSASVACLDPEWRNMASSMIVENTYSNQPGAGQNDYVTFYNDCYSKGFSQSLKPGTYTGTQLGPLRYNISSFAIYGNLRIRAYLNNENMNGAAVTFDATTTCVPSVYNDKIGSLIIEYKSNSNNNPNYPGYPNNNNNGPAADGTYATLFTDCNFNGNALRLMPGTYRGEMLGLLKYNAASIQLSSNLRARVYLDNESLSGSSYTINDDINCMNSNLRNRIGSLVIEERYGNENNNQYPPNSNDPVIIYADGNYKGQAVTLLPGTYSNMAQLNFPDKAVSSLKVPPGFKVVLYEYENFKGKSFTVTESRTGFSLTGWNDRTSSIAVYRN